GSGLTGRYAQDTSGGRRAVAPEDAHPRARAGGVPDPGGRRRRGGPGGLQELRAAPHRARHHAPEARWHGGDPAHPGPERGAGHHAHGQGRRDRPGGRPGARRRRLRHQAICRAGAGGTCEGHHAPGGGAGGPAPRRARLRQAAHQPAEPPGLGGRRRGGPDLHGVRAPGDAGVEPRTGVLAQRAAQAGLGRRVPRRADRGRPHPPPAREDRTRPPQPRVYPHRAWCRICFPL
ncbi:MAG: Response regulator receiver protein in cluster with DNA polymerase III epsilon subunit, partial [uncultured Rubrobacteraceae bacterium]